MLERIRNTKFDRLMQRIVNILERFGLAVHKKMHNIKSRSKASIHFISSIRKIPLLVSFMTLITLIPAFIIIENNHGIIGEPKSNLGEQRVLVLPVYFSDVYPSTSELQINEIMELAAEYIKEVSYSKTWLSWTIQPWTLLDYEAEYYGQESILNDDDSDSHIANQMIMEAVRKTDDSIDFKRFDRLVIFHAGYGEQSSGSYGDSRKDKWLSTSNHPVYVLTNDNVIINSASIVAEFQGVFPSIGALVHELGHDFGAVDLYNPNYGLDIQYWGLMSNGNWVDNQRTPSHMCLYTKLDVGYLNNSQVVPINNGTYTFDINAISIDTDGFYGARYYLTDDTYYLIEARKQVGFDSGLESAGILVTVVNETKDNQEGMVLVVADPRYSLNKRAFGVGEYFVDESSGFGLIVLNETENGFFIQISTDSLVKWQRTAMIDTNLFDPQSGSGSSITVDNGTIFIAVHGFNNTSGFHQVTVFRSNDTGETWHGIFTTPFGVNRKNPVLMVQRVKKDPNPLSVLTRDKVYLICESQFSENNTIEIWDLEDRTAYNITEQDVDARNPSCVSSDKRIFLAYEIRNMSSPIWIRGRSAIALRNALSFDQLRYNVRYIYNASSPWLTRLPIPSEYSERPYLTYLSGPNATCTNEVWIRPFNTDYRFLVYRSPTNITNPSIAINKELELAIVSFENWTYPTNQDCIFVAVNVTENSSPETLKMVHIPLTGANRKPPLVSWGLSPTGNRVFYLAFYNNSMISVTIDETTLEYHSTDSTYKPIPYILTTHQKAERWMSPIICELESGSCFVHRFQFDENSFYQYKPVWVPFASEAPRLMNPVEASIFTSLLGFSFLVGLVGYLHEEKGLNFRRHRRIMSVLVVASIIGILVNYIYAYLVGGGLMFLINFVIEVILSLGIANLFYDIVSDVYNDGTETEVS